MLLKPVVRRANTYFHAVFAALSTHHAIEKKEGRKEEERRGHYTEHVVARRRGIKVRSSAVAKRIY
jgi:hypothetical protein